MNALIVGANKQPILQYASGEFLFIDDGDLIDAISARAKKFDVNKHSFNPLKDMNYRKAVEFVDVLKAAFPEGENTLTKATFEHQILEALLQNPTKLDRLISDTKDTRYAYQKIQRLLMSDVLSRVLNTSLSYTFEGAITVRLNRAELGDFDCFVLGNLIISQYRGTVIVPDFGFYAIPSHTRLIREKRLVAGVTSLEELPEFRPHLMMIEEKKGSRCTPDDAAALALYARIMPGTNGYNDFIAGCIA